MINIECEGFEIAFSNNDEACAACIVAPKCKVATTNKLKSSTGNTGKGETTMAKKLTEKQLKAKLKKITTKKELGALNKEQGYGIKPGKDLDIDGIKALMLETAYPPPPPEDTGADDDFDADDLDDSGDDFGDDDAGGDDLGDDADSDAGAEADEKTPETVVDDGDDIAGDDDVETDTLKALTERVEDLEARLAAVTETLDKTPGKAASNKSSKEEKEAAKAKLLEGCPYTKKTIEALNGREVKQLASALGIKSFGKKTAEVVGAILKSKGNKGK